MKYLVKFIQELRYSRRHSRARNRKDLDSLSSLTFIIFSSPSPTRNLFLQEQSIEKKDLKFLYIIFEVFNSNPNSSTPHREIQNTKLRVTTLLPNKYLQMVSQLLGEGYNVNFLKFTHS